MPALRHAVGMFTPVLPCDSFRRSPHCGVFVPAVAMRDHTIHDCPRRLAVADGIVVLCFSGRPSARHDELAY